jgi:hypothetical protein
MAFTGGMKRPANMMENPIYPDIKQGPPLFKSAGKYWVANPADVLRETETERPSFYNDAILAQNRDYNKQWAYGIDYHKDVVNKAFRPPIRSYEDNFALSRVPRDFVVPRINPSTVSDGGTTAYEAQNTSFNDLDKYVNDRIKVGIARPTFYAPVSMPLDNSVLPDLQLKRPFISASAGYEPFVLIDAPLPDATLDFNRGTVSGESGVVMPYVMDAPNAMEGLELQTNRDFISVTAGQQYDFTPTLSNVEYDLGPAKVESVNQLNIINPTPVDYDMVGLQENTNVNNYLTDRIQTSQSAVPNYNVMDMSATQNSKPFFRQRRANIQTHGVDSAGAIPMDMNTQFNANHFKPKSTYMNKRPQKQYRL